MIKFSILLASLSLATSVANARFKPVIDIMPDASTAQLLKFAQNSGVVLHPTLFLTNTSIEKASKAGERNMAWLKHMNSLNPSAPIALTKPGDLTGIPIDSPKAYSPVTVQRDLDEILKGAPESMQKIIFGTEGFTATPPVDLDVYITWARKIDKVYQTATRWTLMQPYLVELAAQQQYDVRGYYHLNKEKDLKAKLADWENLEKAEQLRLYELLVGICMNTTGMHAVCEADLDFAIKNKELANFHSRYWQNAKAMWDSFFALEKFRTEAVWNSARPDVMTVPFRTTEAHIETFLKTNIEDEFKWKNWHLELVFEKDADIHVEFVPGTTPHVNGLAGNTITMDDNAPLTEWDVQWTIRHEYGHVLGFEDCYVEYYDATKKEMINYQLDTSDLMCSRMGRMKETHYTELKKKYYK